MFSIKSLIFVSFFFAPVVATYKASVICENGSIWTEKRSAEVAPCYSGSCYLEDGVKVQSHSQWADFGYSLYIPIICDGDGQAGLCYKSGSNWYFTDRCTTAYEAFVTVVAEDDRRNLRGSRQEEGRGSDSELTTEEEEVEVDGQSVMVIHPKM